MAGREVEEFAIGLRQNISIAIISLICSKILIEIPVKGKILTNSTPLSQNMHAQRGKSSIDSQ